MAALATSTLLPPALSSGFAATPDAQPGLRRWTLIETARDNGHRLAALPEPAAGADADAAIVCDPRQRDQQILGFGGALTESAAYVLQQLPKAKRMQVLHAYYDPADGIGYTLARTHIGSCDFSLTSWTLDDTADDRALRHFSLAPMRARQLPLIRDVQRLVGANRFKLVASPWSPPAWMKTNGQLVRGGTLRTGYEDAWADCYVRFLKAMRDEEKIPVWALTVQNEPDAAQPWESCLYLPREESSFVAEFLGPALQKARLADVKLFGWDHNRDGLEVRAAALLGNADSAKYLAGLALHWYGDEDFAASRRVLDAFPDKQILFTEGCVEGGAHAGEWEPAERYARNIIGDLDNGVCGFIDWNIALDMQGGPNHVGNFCHAPVLIDTAEGEVHYQPSFHYIAHFSKYVRPGATRLKLQGRIDALQSIAFANPDGSLVVIVVNPGDDARAFTLDVAGDTRACNLPAHAIHTYIVSRL
ncbi:MAG: glycoside hydrolase family 30 beta sandwich domain-containing protein [Rudaea sp.]|nr:glycoside hydrolase family 30 beta sandwich domain-containing protein [Rudaea sp.]